MYFFVQKEQTFVQIFRKEGDVFPDFSRCFLGNTTSCDVEFQSDRVRNLQSSMNKREKNKKPTLIMRIGFLYVRNNRFSITS